MFRTPEQQHLHDCIESHVAPLRRELKKLKQDQKPEMDKKLNIALTNFKKQYPMITSADLQTFMIGWNACNDALKM